MSRETIIEMLARMRAQWRLLGPQGQAGFRIAALSIFSLIEGITPEADLWSSSPDEDELTSQSRIGDHLNVTRRLLGCTP